MDTFEKELEADFAKLLKRKSMLYPVDHPNYDFLANTTFESDAASSGPMAQILPQVHVTCQTLWTRASEVLGELDTKRKTNYNVSECCIGFYVSEAWLNEDVQGDTHSILESWDDLAKCVTRISNIFPSLTEEKRMDLARQICSSRKLCIKFFSTARSDYETLDLKTVRLIHTSLTSTPSSHFRTSHSCNDLGMPYLEAKDIEVHMGALLKFINGKIQNDEANALPERLLLSVLFLERFLKIHPFNEGNGRTARFLFSVLMRPICSMSPIPLFLRDQLAPRHLYIQSLRGNPYDNPLCLAFYALRCVLENAKRVLDFVQPAPKESASLDSEQSNVLDTVWREVHEAYPSLRPQHIRWINEHKEGFLVVFGEKSLYDDDCQVFQIESSDEMRLCTVNRNSSTYRVFDHSELFSISVETGGTV